MALHVYMVSASISSRKNMKSLVRIQKNKNITLPVWAMKKYRVELGDYLQVAETPAGLVLKPVKIVDADQSWFWTREWQEGEAEAGKEIREGRVKKFRNVKELAKNLRS